jgi:hypothetical protein
MMNPDEDERPPLNFPYLGNSLPPPIETPPLIPSFLTTKERAMEARRVEIRKSYEEEGKTGCICSKGGVVDRCPEHGWLAANETPV